jgi:hypothetical protein
VQLAFVLEGDSVASRGVSIVGELVDVFAGHLLLGVGRAGSYPAGACSRDVVIVERVKKQLVLVIAGG